MAPVAFSSERGSAARLSSRCRCRRFPRQRLRAFFCASGKGKTGVRDGTAAGRLYLGIPYANKDEAKKQLGARWGPARRKWYVDAAKVSREQAARWLPSS
ncbi:DUF5710 domain-containing protein [Streptomyces sp. RM99]|uniref:DUF5710 domain-containing protein n=1 Tax=Streptomyces sp. RM99 TaxID=2824897 RepID=UPI0027DAEFAE|nr:DUF5710 domain-containing protein [Streptomyces sp. RM99]